MGVTDQFKGKVDDPILSSKNQPNDVQEDNQGEEENDEKITNEEENEEGDEKEEITDGNDTNDEDQSDSEDDADDDNDDGDDDSDEEDERDKKIKELEEQLAKEKEQAEKRKKRFKKGKKKVSETVEKKVGETEADYEQRIRNLELKNFFIDHPNAKEFEKDIVKMADAKSLSLEESMKLVMFDRYADEGFQNQKAADKNNISGKPFRQKESDVKNSRLKQPPKFLQNMKNIQERKNTRYGK